MPGRLRIERNVLIIFEWNGYRIKNYKDIYGKYNNIEYSFPSFLDVRKEGKMLANTSAYGHKLKKYD
jgi:hypothetical protein